MGVTYLEECESTQLEARKLADDGAPHGAVVVARRQTAGRGRLGRTWISTGEALTFSMVLRPALPTSEAPRLTLTAGVAVLAALDELGVRCQLKWPNDVMWEGRKLAGILAEATRVVSTPGGASASRVDVAILGVGLNVRGYPEGVNATSLEEAGYREGDVLATLLRHLPGDPADFTRVLDLARKRSATLGREVTVSDGTQGLAVDLDPDGALLVETDTCLVTVRAGDVL